MIQADSLSGWETALALYNHLLIYIVRELEADPSTRQRYDGMQTLGLVF